MKLRKLVATGLVATMVLGNSVMAFAEEAQKATASGTGTGTLEGVVNSDVLSVTLPTTATETLKYIADPQGLIAKTDSAHYSDKTFGTGSIFFENKAEGAEFNYSNKSDALTVTNKSSKPVKLSVKAKATVGQGTNNASLATSDSLSQTDAEVYLALVDDNATTNILTAADQEVTKVLGAAPEEAYEYKYEGGKYTYALKSDTSSYIFPQYSVYITGAASAEGWKDDTTVPSVDVVWNAAFAGSGDHVDIETPEQISAPSIATTSYKVEADNELVIPVSLGSGDKAATGIASVIWNGTNLLGDTIKYDSSTGKLTVGTACTNYWTSTPSAPRTFVVNFNDAANTAITITVTTD